MEAHLGVHGDNIVECRRAQKYIEKALVLTSENPPEVRGPIWSPTFVYTQDQGSIGVTLYPGHGRWGGDFFRRFGAAKGLLCEAVDVLLTEFVNLRRERRAKQVPLLGIEFCGALPAGNNAWQRAGRAWSTGILEIPYLFVGELGGQELDSEGNAKAPRFPSPIVSGSFLVYDSTTVATCLPIYIPSPTADENVKTILGEERGMVLLEQAIHETIVEGRVHENTREAIRQLTLDTIRFLRQERKRNDTMSASMWEEVARLGDPKGVASWWLNQGSQWSKKVAGKTCPPLLDDLIRWLKLNGVSLGAREFPAVLIPWTRREALSVLLQSLYGEDAVGPLGKWLCSDTSKSLVVAMICGFKPRGDDSRPDRGVIPTVRMLLGNAEVDILSVIYGPAKRDAWRQLSRDPARLARSNGLWKSIVDLSNALWVASDDLPSEVGRAHLFGDAQPAHHPPPLQVVPTQTVEFGEHDVDTVLHLVFSAMEWPDGFESMCNPPGGDWSGCELSDGKKIYRWSSLPRVSPTGGKRPDHVLQLNESILAIESKAHPERVSRGIGPRLTAYVRDLFCRPPQAWKPRDRDEWKRFDRDDWPTPLGYRSCVAFEYNNPRSLVKALERSKADLAMAIRFHRKMGSAQILVASKDDGDEFIERIRESSKPHYGDLIDINAIGQTSPF